MRLLHPSERAALGARLRPDRPGPLVGLHVLHSGHGACFVDRWPEPLAVLSVAGPNYSLQGDPGAFTAQELRPLIEGMVDAPPEFEPLLEAVAPDLGHWPRIISRLPAAPLAVTVDAQLRRLSSADAFRVYSLTNANLWIAETWGGATGLCAGGLAFGAFVEGRLASIACSFYVGDRFEDIGVVTEPSFRGRGLSVACSAALCGDIRSRGRTPSWSTSPDNLASLRVAEKLGFQHDRNDVLYVVGDEVPESARPQSIA